MVNPTKQQHFWHPTSHRSKHAAHAPLLLASPVVPALPVRPFPSSLLQPPPPPAAPPPPVASAMHMVRVGRGVEAST